MSSVLETLSQDLAALVQGLSPSLVRVEARRRLPATGIVWSNDGVIVTASHVIESKTKDIMVGLDNGERVKAELIGRDPMTDIALLKAAGSFQAATWGGADDLHVGSLVLALGRPDAKVMATLGVIMALQGPWKTREGGHFDHYLQTDVVMYPGFSGGALAGGDHKILAMNTSGLSRGVSLAITRSTIERVGAALMQHGHIKRGYLGVGIQPVQLPADLAQQLGQHTGVLVTSVEADSPAAKAGFMLGDTLVHFDGQPVPDVDDLLSLLVGERVGKTLTAKILRAGQLHEISVTVAERQ
jgi:S1-C subfamily serine protease